MSGWTRRKALRRWLFTRCEGCGGRIKRGQQVGRHGDIHEPMTRQIILGEVGLYHLGCPVDPVADYAAMRSYDRSWGHDRSCRTMVLGEPEWMAAELSTLALDRDQAAERYMDRLLHYRMLGGREFTWRHPSSRANRDETT